MGAGRGGDADDADGGKRGRRSPRPLAAAARGLLGPRRARLGADRRAGDAGAVRARAARHVAAGWAQAHAFDQLPRPLGRAAGGARRPVRPAGGPGQPARVRARRLRLGGGPALLPSLGLRPRRHHPLGDLQPHPPRRPAARRLHDHPAAGAQPVPEPRPELSPQGAGVDPVRRAGVEVQQEADPGALPQPCRLRRWRDGDRGGEPALLQQAGVEADHRRGGAAGGPAKGALSLQPGERPGARGAPRHHRARQDGRDRRHHQGAGGGRVQPAGDRFQDLVHPARAVLRRLGRPGCEAARSPTRWTGRARRTWWWRPRSTCPSTPPPRPPPARWWSAMEPRG